MGQLSPDQPVARDVQKHSSRGRSGSNHVIQTRALRDDERTVLLDQGGVPESEHCGVVTEGPDGLMNIFSPDCCKIAEPRKKTGVLEWAPGERALGGSGRRTGRGSGSLLLQNHPIKEVSVGEWHQGKCSTEMPLPPAKGDLGLRQYFWCAKKAYVDDLHGFRHGDDLRVLGGDSHVVKLL